MRVEGRHGVRDAGARQTVAGRMNPDQRPIVRTARDAHRDAYHQVRHRAVLGLEPYGPVISPPGLARRCSICLSDSGRSLNQGSDHADAN